MIYLLLALLFIFVPAVRTSVMGMGSGLSALEQERQFYYTLFVIGAILLALHLVTENLDSAILRRSVSQYEGKINELKAKLYDQQQRATAPVVAPVSRTTDGRVYTEPVPVQPVPVQTSPVQPTPAHPTQSQAAGTVSLTENRTADHLPQPIFPQSDPSLTNTPPAERPPLS
ncbi:hypothetical protein AUC43_01815 [Hymenobacter sedentarius]|uniref:Uncharacterized protein n=2 Tax=Hymenobacter sedentarius TaxID=1411621 RepID=A0A0U4BJS8_9BACT|nr:hypothetical protein AUC43_01815 [Hymenobacter sedentarius]